MKRLFWLLTFSLIPNVCCAMDNTSIGSSLETDDADSSATIPPTSLPTGSYITLEKVIPPYSEQQFMQHFQTIDTIKNDEEKAVQQAHKQFKRRWKGTNTLTIDNHNMTKLPKLENTYYGITQISITKGPLNDPQVLCKLLKACPFLKTLDLSRNQLSTLGEEIVTDYTILSGNSYSEDHDSLKNFSCTHNPITTIDFTRLKYLMPNLKKFDVSGCDKLTNFTAHSYHGPICDPLTTITLHNTELSDETKKEIMKHSQHVAHNCAGGRLYCLGFFGGAVSGTIFGLSTTIGFGLSAGPIAVFTGTLITSMAVPALIIGPAVAYPVIIGRTPREKREITRYIVDFGPDFKPSVEETTTWYQRFVRNFPEFSRAHTKDTPASDEV
jgi:hypothetical protein